VTFVGDQGDLEDLQVHTMRYEQQTVAVTGGTPTPLGGTYKLKYGTATSAPIAYDATAAEVKAAIEAIPGVGRVDINMPALTAPAVYTVTFRYTAHTSYTTIVGTLLLVCNSFRSYCYCYNAVT
jgi:copper chaperone CopZ